MNFSSLLQWWEEWQLRILVLGSQLLQFLLFITSRARSGRPSFYFRSSVWLAYLASDALAVYALATLFNRHKLPKGGGGGDDDTSDDLEILWAPILLIHLGGQHPMTAYSIEDNELWRRHIVTLVSQVTVAIYVFCKSWPRDDRMLLQAAILLFIIGILKFCQKPVALKRASIASLTTSWAVCPPREGHGGTLGKVTEWLFTDLVTLSSLRGRGEIQKQQEEDGLSLGDYVKEAKKLVSPTEQEEDVDERYRPNFMRSISLLFVDQSAPFARRLGILWYFMKVHRRGHAYQDLTADIGIAFKLFYTNLKGTLSFPGMLLKLLLVLLTIPPIVLFSKTHKPAGYHKVDIVVTYILLCSTSLLEFPGFFFVINVAGRWRNTVAQHNIISFWAHKSSSKLMKLASLMCSDEFEAYISKHRYTEQESESRCIDITNLVIDHVKDGWMQYIHDCASYKRFNSLRGQWTMTRHGSRLHKLRWTLRLPFDKSVLVWHLATELCLHHPRSSPGVVQDKDPCRLSNIISNYMIYLLFVRPEMLAPGTNQGLFMTACDDIDLMLKHADNPASWDRGSVARWVLRIANFPWVNNDETLVLRACQLAEHLMEVLPDEDERWNVIQGVWVEMLCFSASRCRGYLHAKSMGNGVEFLTYVWLLLSDMGMETFADKFQMPDLEEVVQEEEEAATAAAATSKLQVAYEEEEIV